MINKNIKKAIEILIFVCIILFYKTAFSFQMLNPPYNQSDPNFNKLAIRVYNSNSPYTYAWGAYTYNAILITTTYSGCKIISIIRRTQGFPNPHNWAIENYKICGDTQAGAYKADGFMPAGVIAEVENTNPAGWDNLPREIKPVINNAIQDVRQFGKATANYYGYRVIAKTGAYIGTVYVYVLNGIKLEAMMRF